MFLVIFRGILDTLRFKTHFPKTYTFQEISKSKCSNVGVQLRLLDSPLTLRKPIIIITSYFSKVSELCLILSIPD